MAQEVHIIIQSVPISYSWIHRFNLHNKLINKCSLVSTALWWLPNLITTKKLMVNIFFLAGCQFLITKLNPIMMSRILSIPKIVELHRAESTRSIHLYKTFVCVFGTWKTKTNDFELVHLLTIAFCAVFKSKMAILGRARQPYTVESRVLMRVTN